MFNNQSREPAKPYSRNQLSAIAWPASQPVVQAA